MIKRFLDFWNTVSLPAKAAVIGAVLLIVMLLSGGITAAVSKWKDARFDRQIEALKVERQADIKRGDDAEARAIAAESQKAKLELAFEVAGKSAEAAMEKINVAEKKFADQENRINSDIDNCTRLAELRAALRLAPKPCP